MTTRWCRRTARDQRRSARREGCNTIRTRAFAAAVTRRVFERLAETASLHCSLHDTCATNRFVRTTCWRRDARNVTLSGVLPVGVVPPPGGWPPPPGGCGWPGA